MARRGRPPKGGYKPTPDEAKELIKTRIENAERACDEYYQRLREVCRENALLERDNDRLRQRVRELEGENDRLRLGAT